MAISLKTKYVRTDGWRGYSQPVNAVAGANDTGTYSDSPCPSDVATKELNTVKAELKKANIKFRETACETSNVFCVHRYIVVAEADRTKGIEIAQDVLKNTENRLLYVVND